MSTDPDDMADEIQRVEEYRRKQMWAMTPEQRVEAGLQLTRLAFQQLRSNPPAYQAFLAREHHKRRTVTEPEA